MIAARFLTLAAALVLTPALRAEPKLAGSGVAINRSATGGGGGASAGGAYKLQSLAGETGATAAAGGAVKAAPGLMELISQPGSVISLTAVTKTTGTLELAWNSPGLDGFQTDVVNGFYRIDATSDPANHVFDPTTFLVELPTTTTPGDPQRYELTGLEPNTTYYARVYLADARKFFAETSTQSADSTLARAPQAPAFSGVFQSSVQITWTLPAGGAAGFRVDASSLSGITVSSSSPNGVTVTLTVTGLLPLTTYYFNVASLNWQSDASFASVLSTVTSGGGPLPVQTLALAGNNLDRTVTLTWTNPVFANPAGVTILVSTNPITATLTDGTPYPLGTLLADGSIVASTAPAASFLEAGLELDVTGYFQVHSRDLFNSYSVAVATAIVLDLPPMAPAALQAQLSPGGTSYALSWGGVASNLNGFSFKNGFAPTSWELHRFDVYRATGIVNASWVWIGSTSFAGAVFAAEVPVPGGIYYYRVVSRDAFDGSLSDNAMAIDTLGNLWAVHRDGVTRMRIPPSLASTLLPAGNSLGRPLLVRAVDRPQDLGGKILKSVDFSAAASPSNAKAQLPTSATDKYGVALRYEVAGGVVVPSGAGVLSDPNKVSAANAANALAAYYVDNGNAAKVFGRVDPASQEVTVESGLLGGYQIRSLARGAAFEFDMGGVSNKAITPNGDGLNDTVVFTFDNPKDSGITGKIFDIRGRFVADMRPGPIAGATLLWDGKAGGAAVPRGVYIYQIQAEGKTFNGSVVVIR